MRNEINLKKETYIKHSAEWNWISLSLVHWKQCIDNGPDGQAQLDRLKIC